MAELTLLSQYNNAKDAEIVNCVVNFRIYIILYCPTILLIYNTTTNKSLPTNTHLFAQKTLWELLLLSQELNWV